MAATQTDSKPDPTAAPWQPMSLAGRWLLCADPQNQGLDEKWWSSSSWWDKSDSMEIPGPFQRALGAGYHGVAWMARVVAIPAEWQKPGDNGSRLWLRFDAVATDATVWVNGIEVGRHVGDFLPFQFDITEAVEAGWSRKAPLNPPSDREINICVRVDEMPAPRPPPGTTTEAGHITKGFHDVLSIQHGGIWGDVTLSRTGKRWIIPNGIRVITHPDRSRFTLRIELGGVGSGESLTFSASDGQRNLVAMGSDTLTEATTWEREIQIGRTGDLTTWTPDSDQPDRFNLSLGAPNEASAAEMNEQVAIVPWSPDSPALYKLILDVVSGDKPREVVESHTLRFGFRTVTTGGPNNSHILLNGKPLLIRGVLHWGHEPEHISPAPPPDQIRAEFARLKEMGFNCVCLCMWYPPPYYFDIADEVGMLIWQEHPIWKSPMEEELIPEYQRMLESFFRRDRNHPSVVIVSGSCEHERIHPDLAAWWWKRAKDELPDRLVQVQTAFTAWVNPNQVDMHDEHVYESSGRWVKFCEDLQPALKELPPKPFVMGETIIGTSWVDAAAVRKAIQSRPESSVRSPESKRAAPDIPTQDSGPPNSGPSLPWWAPKGLAECEAFEQQIAERFGSDTLARFKRAGDLANLQTRKFQSEVLRMYPNHAGWVMNQIRDVPAGRLGFMDDLGRWRFSPEQTRPWLSKTIALLRTPDHRRGFVGTGEIAAEIGISNFGSEPFEGSVQLRLAAAGHERDIDSPVIRAGLGEVGFARVRLPLPTVDRPTRINARAVAPGVPPNGWDLWAFPPIDDVPPDVVRLDGLTFSKKDLEPEFEERCYSSGWGLKVRTWKAIMPHPETVLFKAPLWRFDGPLPPNTRVVVTHKLTASVVDFLVNGGRVLLLASRTAGGLGTKFLNVWGQVPLVIEEGPLGSGDADWIADLLHYDLTRRYTRAIPSEDLGIADQVDPLVRLVFTHDRGAPKLLDAAFATRVGSGMLLATSLDHTEDPGRYLLQRFLEWLASDTPTCAAELARDKMAGWISEK